MSHNVIEFEPSTTFHMTIEDFEQICAAATGPSSIVTSDALPRILQALPENIRILLANKLTVCSTVNDAKQVFLKEVIYAEDHLNGAITLQNLANAYIALGNLPEALSYAIQAHEIFRAYEHLRTEKSASLIDKILTLQNLEQELSATAFQALKAGLYQVAIRSFEQLIVLNYHHKIYYHNLACAYHLLGISSQNPLYFMKAESFFQKALELAPRSFNAHLEYANFLRQQKRYGESITMLDGVLNQPIASDDILSYGEKELPSLPKELELEVKTKGSMIISHLRIFAYYLKVSSLDASHQKIPDTLLTSFEDEVNFLKDDPSAPLYYQFLYYSYLRSGQEEKAKASLEMLTSLTLKDLHPKNDHESELQGVHNNTRNCNKCRR